MKAACPNCGLDYETAVDLRRWKDGLWLPIETAPTDGTVVLIYAATGVDGWNGVHVARYSGDNIGNGYRHCWKHASYQNLGAFVSGVPSHWMPLPELPVVSNDLALAEPTS